MWAIVTVGCAAVLSTRRGSHLYRDKVADTDRLPQCWVVSVSTKRAVFPENVSVELVALAVPHSSELALVTPPPVAVKNPVALMVPVNAGNWNVSPGNVISPVMVSCDPT